MAPIYTLVDIVPKTDSSEIQQNSEPSVAVNPLDPRKMIAGAFQNDNNEPYYKSTDGGATWFDYGHEFHIDKSIAWLADGSAALTTALFHNVISTYSGTTAGNSFGTPISTYSPGHDIDQPWIVTGPSNQVYVGYNDLPDNSGGKTASVLVSANGGTSYTPVLLDRVGDPNGLQDSPSIRLAVNGSTVYAIFIRWNSLLDTNAYGDDRYNSSFVVVRSDNSGADNFMALGTNGNGVQIAAMTDVFTNGINTPLTLGQERTGGEIAIAVDPNNAAHVVVVYGTAPGAADSNPSQLQLVVMESFNSGANWTQKYTTSSSTRSGEPALSILLNGTIGLLYDNYDPASDQLSQHFLTTSDDFVTVNDTTLATESNSTPTHVFEPYVGDFFNLTSLGNTFYGTFSASNADDGINASLPNVTFNRRFTGTPGTSNFQLVDANGNKVASSIDPFFFSYVVLNPAPPPGATANMVLRNAGNPPGTATYEIYNLGNNTSLAAYWLGQVGTDWGFVTLGGFNDGDTSDMLLRNSTSGAFQVYNVANNDNNISGSASLGAVGLNWQASGFGNFGSFGETDMMLRNVNTGGLEVYNINNNQITGTSFMGTVGLNWQFSGIGNFSSRGTSDMLLRNMNTGGLQVYDINSNQITGSAFIGTVGLDWQFSGVGNFSSAPGETDLLLRNSTTGGLEVYDINNNQITGAAFIGTVGLDWQFAGIAPIHAAGASDLVLRNVNTGAFEVYNIANNQLIGAVSLATVGLNWQLGGFAPAGSTGSSGSTSQLVQAMAGFGGGSGAGESLNTVALGADASQQSLLATPQHA